MHTTLGQVLAELSDATPLRFTNSQRFSTNTHLAYEMCRADFTFLVVNDLFTVHRGIKRSMADAEKQAIKLAQKHYRHVRRLGEVSPLPSLQS